MDVVYRVRAGERNEALRYSLRSLRYLEHGRVWVIGHRPRWVTGVEHVPGEGCHDRMAMLGDLVRAASVMGVDDALLVDDDMCLLGPWDPEVLHRGPLATHAAMERGAYAKSLATTDGLLSEHGVHGATSYELHVPLPFSPARLASLLAPFAGLRTWLQARSLYGNLAGLGGTRAPDVKVRRAEDLPPKGPLLSSAAGARFGLVQPTLARMLPDPSPYEVAA